MKPMPLLQGKSKSAFEHNVRVERKAGKPLKQALAIAYDVKRRAQGKAHGGMVKGYSDGGIMRDKMMDDMMMRRKMRMMSKGGMVYPDADYGQEMEDHMMDETNDLTWPPPSREGSKHPREDRRNLLRKIMAK